MASSPTGTQREHEKILYELIRIAKLETVAIRTGILCEAANDTT